MVVRLFLSLFFINFIYLNASLAMEAEEGSDSKNHWFKKWPSASSFSSDTRIKLIHVNQIIKEINEHHNGKNLKDNFLHEFSEEIQNLKENAASISFSPYFRLKVGKDQLESLYKFTGEELNRNWTQTISNICISFSSDKIILSTLWAGCTLFWVYIPSLFDDLFEKRYKKNQELLADFSVSFCPSNCPSFYSYTQQFNLVRENDPAFPEFDTWANEVSDKALADYAIHTSNANNSYLKMVLTALKSLKTTSHCYADNHSRIYMSSTGYFRSLPIHEEICDYSLEDSEDEC